MRLSNCRVPGEFALWLEGESVPAAWTAFRDIVDELGFFTRRVSATKVLLRCPGAVHVFMSAQKGELPHISMRGCPESLPGAWKVYEALVERMTSPARSDGSDS